MSEHVKMHHWLVSFERSWETGSLEGEIEVKAPRWWDVPGRVRAVYPNVIIKGISWILPEEEEDGCPDQMQQL